MNKVKKSTRTKKARDNNIIEVICFNVLNFFRDYPHFLTEMLHTKKEPHDELLGNLMF